MRYVKLYGTYAKLSLMSRLVYKVDAIIGIIAFLFTEATSLMTLYFLVSAVPMCQMEYPSMLGTALTKK